jgi:xanthine permease XanP
MEDDMEQVNDKLELVYGLEDKPSPVESAYAAFQHLLAIIVGIITPTLIIGGVLGLGERIPYLISMSLIVSGVATFIQAKRIGPVGSGLLSVQGTSFAFLGAILTAGFIVKGQGADRMKCWQQFSGFVSWVHSSRLSSAASSIY